MADNNNSSDEEVNVFRDFISNTKDFKVLINNKYNPHEDASLIRHYAPKDRRIEDMTELDYKTLHSIKLSTHIWRPLVSADEYLFYFQSGVQYKTIRKLRAGKIRVEDTLDLHQKNKEQAAIELARFFEEAYENEKRCVCIIHGKGNRSNQSQPILKNLINHWLQDINIILGFCSCPPGMGDTGAVLVLLKRPEFIE